MTQPKLWIAAAVLLALASAGAAQQPGGSDILGGFDSPAEVDVEGDFTLTARLEPPEQAPGHPVVAVVAFACPQGWYIYENSVSVAVAPPQDADPVVSVRDVRLPPPQVKYDKFLEEQVSYYEGGFSARLVLDVLDGAQEAERTLTLKASYQGCSEKLCYAPATRELEVRLSVLAAGADPVPVDLTQEPAVSPPRRPEADFTGRSLAASVVLAFVLGLGLVLTPCVYPMIPITMSVIGATTTDRRLSALVRSLVYVLGISVTYALLGVIAAKVGGVFGTLLQHPAVYLALAALFAVMAASMLGLFTIQVEGSRVARLQERLRGRAGLVGVFALGLLSGVAVTPCAAPAVFAAMGYVLKTGNAVAGFLIFFAIAWGMGVPLVVVGTFGGLLKSLPKPGRWQETVKGAFGLGLLGAGVYFVGLSRVLPDLWYRMFVGAFLLSAGVFVGAFDSLTDSSGWLPRAKKALGLMLAVGALAAFAQPLLAGRTAAPGPRISWITSEQSALGAAAQQGAPVMLYFWQERCAECVQLKKGTFTDPGVVDESRRFACAEIDGTEAGSPAVRRVLQEYGVIGFPTIAFVASDGRRLNDRTLRGYVSAEELLEVMRSVR